jgi:ABC-type nickel/cobalt efflux system permease component RcnA
MQFVIRWSHLIGIYDPVAIQTAAGVFAGGSALLIANFAVWMLWDLMRR